MDQASEIINNATTKWSGCKGLLVYDPFLGLAVAAPGFYRSSEEIYEQSIELAGSIEEELPLWSRQFPDVNFVFIGWEAWGLEVEFRGCVCHDGHVFKRISGEHALDELVAELGVVLGVKHYIHFIGTTKSFRSYAVELILRVGLR